MSSSSNAPKTSIKEGEIIYVPTKPGVVNSGLTTNSELVEKNGVLPRHIVAGSDIQAAHSIASIVREGPIANNTKGYSVIVVKAKKNLSLASVSVPTGTYTYEIPMEPRYMVPVLDENNTHYGKTPSGAKYYFDPTPRRCLTLESVTYNSDNFELIAIERYDRSPVFYGK